MGRVSAARRAIRANASHVMRRIVPRESIIGAVRRMLLSFRRPERAHPRPGNDKPSVTNHRSASESCLQHG